MGRAPEAAIATFAATLEYEDLPNGVVETVTRAFVDTIGVTVAGSTEGAGRKATETAGIDPGDADAASLLGLGSDAPPESVALRIGTASHALDYDDLSWAMDGHPSVTLVPPLLALADDAGATGRDLATAYVAGFEAECAVAEPISPDHYEAGWHATATFGTIGAAAAAARLLELSPDETAHALNIAASTASGLKRNFGSMTKPLHAGLCSRSGVTAARLARDGFTADGAAISGDRGFWELYGPDDRGEFAIGDGWYLEDGGIHIKSYPCCYFTHTAIAAARRLADDRVDPGTVERVLVESSRGAADALHHADPDTGLEAKFSMQYAVASAIVRDRVGLDTFREGALDDPDVQRVRERVEFTTDESLPYDSHVSTVRIETEESVFEHRQENPPGTHENPLSAGELREKFSECAGRLLSADEVDRLYQELASLPELGDVSETSLSDV